MNGLTSIVIIFVLLVAIDIPYLTYFNRSMIKDMLDRINQGKEVDKKRAYFSGFLVYLAMAIGIYVFVIEWGKDKDGKDILYRGMLFGCILYILYDMTNLASIANFQVKDAVVDVLWGTVLCGTVSFIFFKLL
jgi:uncharacterized membrane protein